MYTKHPCLTLFILRKNKNNTLRTINKTTYNNNNSDMIMTITLCVWTKLLLPSSGAILWLKRAIPHPVASSAILHQAVRIVAVVQCVGLANIVQCVVGLVSPMPDVLLSVLLLLLPFTNAGACRKWQSDQSVQWYIRRTNPSHEIITR